MTWILFALAPSYSGLWPIIRSSHRPQSLFLQAVPSDLDVEVVAMTMRACRFRFQGACLGKSGQVFVCYLNFSEIAWQVLI